MKYRSDLFNLPVYQFTMDLCKKDNTSWAFQSAADNDVNWKDIKDTLSYKEPLALVTREYKEYEEVYNYVVINDQLWDKAVLIKADIPASISPISKKKLHVFRVANNFSEWVDWAKFVKKASWPDGYKFTFKVTLPTV